MGELHNRKALKESRRQLRNALTPAEAVLWKALQRSQLEGRKFRRQHSVGAYILDFYCPSEQLAVELDGAAHFTHAGQMHDAQRSEFLAQVGIRVVRFENRYVFSDMESVLAEISRHFKTNPSPETTCKKPPLPPAKEGLGGGKPARMMKRVTNAAWLTVRAGNHPGLRPPPP